MAALCLLAAAFPHAARPDPSRTPSDTTARPAPSPAEAFEEAREAQSRFERTRRRHFPRTRASYASRCDEVVGRYCFWHEDLDWIPPPEEEEVARARLELLAALAEAAGRLPAGWWPDGEGLSARGWVAGQRVRYLVEAGRTDEAVRTASACGAVEAWWCAALDGYARHAGGDHEAAGSAFARALRRMPAERRCRWADLEPLLDGEGRDRYGDLPCGSRGGLEARFWWLADPLWVTPGNERRTEHHARRVLDLMQEEAASGYGVRWGDDLRELLLRYGWPAGWESAWPRPGSLGGPSPVAHDRPGSLRFVPRGEWLDPDRRIEPGEWELDPDEPRTHYAPDSTHLRALRALDHRHQVARFRRGADTLLVVAAWASDRDTLPPCDSALALLAVGRTPETVSTTRRGGPGADGSLSVRVVGRPSGPPLLLGLESLCLRDRVAGRARYTLDWPDQGRPAAGLSDLLLTAPEPLPADLAAAARAARPSERLRPGERVGVYWEVYPRSGDIDGARTTLALSRRGGGLLRKVAELVGLAGDREAEVGLRWRELPLRSAVEPRSVAFALPEELGEGDYTLHLEVEIPGSRPLRATRPIRVEDAR